MKKGYIRFGEIMMMWVLVIIILLPFFIFLGVDNNITIEKPYHDEYEECKEELEVCEEIITPECNCKCSSNLFLLGFMVFFMLLLFFGDRFDKRKKKRRNHENNIF